MNLFDDIKVYENVFGGDQLQKLIKLSLRGKWGFQSSSTHSKNKKFLCMELTEKFVTEELLRDINNLTGQQFILHRAYFNGSFYGMAGFPHYDSEEPNRFTFLVYLNEEWNFLWGGQTIFFDRFVNTESKQVEVNSQNHKSFFPVWNTALFFPGNIFHYAESPTRDCQDIRLTLAFKLERILT